MKEDRNLNTHLGRLITVTGGLLAMSVCYYLLFAEPVTAVDAAIVGVFAAAHMVIVGVIASLSFRADIHGASRTRTRRRA